MMLKALVLVCATHTGNAACTVETALKSIEGPVVSSIALCEFQATVISAQNRQIPGTFLKTSCVPAPGVGSLALDFNGPHPRPQFAAAQ